MSIYIFITIVLLAYLAALQNWYGHGWRVWAVLFRKPLRVPVIHAEEIQFELRYEDY